MGSQIKNILHFVGVPVGGTVSLPHELNWNGTPVVPDHAEADAAGFEITADEINVTITAAGSSGDVDVLVESWHTIEREFGDIAIRALNPQPFVPQDGGGGIPTPPFSVGAIIIYARTTGSDTTGNGRTIPTAYRTFQRAVRDVPNIVPPGVNYIVDITGITEELPPDYALPAWKAPLNNGSPPLDDVNIIFTAPVAIFAEPQLVAAVPAADAVINPGDVASVTADPITGLKTIHLSAPRASWTTGNLKGKQTIDAAAAVNNSVIYNVTTTTISIALFQNPTFPLQLVEPSATLHGTPTNFGALNANNIDSIAFNCLRITTDDSDFYGLSAMGTGAAICQMCELDNPFIDAVASGVGFGTQNRVIRCWTKGLATFANSIFMVQGLNDTLIDGPIFNAPCVPSMRGMVFDGCDPIFTVQLFATGLTMSAVTDHFALRNSLVRNGTGDGLVFHGSSGFLANVDFSANAGNGITVGDGAGFLEVNGCGSTTPNLGDYGIQINDGLFVRVDAGTAVTQPTAGRPLTGATDDTKVGNLAAQDWATFVAGGSNRFDIAGATATGSRLFQ